MAHRSLIPFVSLISSQLSALVFNLSFQLYSPHFNWSFSLHCLGSCRDPCFMSLLQILLPDSPPMMLHLFLNLAFPIRCLSFRSPFPLPDVSSPHPAPCGKSTHRLQTQHVSFSFGTVFPTVPSISVVVTPAALACVYIGSLGN